MSAGTHPPRALLVFLDGIGIGDPDPSYNPCVNSDCAFMVSKLGGMPTLAAPSIYTDDMTLVPLDATLGVEGLPQSGTGQAALFTGMNTARRVKRHFGPYLYSTLKPMVEQFGLFARLERMGLKEQTALANAFPQRFFDYINGSRRRMVAGMYMADTAGIPFRDIDFLKRGEAVSTDFTGERWKDIGHPDAPVITPHEAGRRVADIALQNRFTLFEYFRTDKPGHDMDMDFAVAVLQDLDAFLSGLYKRAQDANLLVAITSDHGNIEDIRTKTHTRNPVPLIVFGPGHKAFADASRSIMDVAPNIIRYILQH